jgi:hypothetical protein
MISAHDIGMPSERIEMGCPYCGQLVVVDHHSTVHNHPVCASFVVMPAHEYIEKCVAVLKSELHLEPN